MMDSSTHETALDEEGPRFVLTSTRAITEVAEAPMGWVVPGYVGEGLTILAGRQKVGKTWIAMDWASAVASGGAAMGAIACEEGDVLYVDLENGRRRVRSRIAALHPDSARPDLSRLAWAIEAPPLGKGLVEALENWRSSAARPRLVVIDAAQKPGWKGSTGDCAGLAQLQRWATGQGVGVVWLHRMRKVGDPLVALGGSGGVFGFADAILLLDRDDTGGTLQVRGRDGEDRHSALAFAAGVWSLAGDAADLNRSQQHAEILELLEGCVEPVGPSEVAGALGRPPGNIKVMMFRMAKAGELTRIGRGLYRHPKQVQKSGEIERHAAEVRAMLMRGPEPPPLSPDEDREAERQLIDVLVEHMDPGNLGNLRNRLEKALSEQTVAAPFEVTSGKSVM